MKYHIKRNEYDKIFNIHSLNNFLNISKDKR